MKKIMLTEIEFRKIKQVILLEQNEDEFYKISPQEFLDLMKFAEYNGKAVSKLKMFAGKPLWITGDLDLGDTPTDSLGNVKYIQGKLNIQNTNISDLSGVEVKGYITNYGTPMEARRKAKERREKLQSAEERRLEKEWDLDNPEITNLGLKANALYQSLLNSGDIENQNEEDENELIRLENEIERITDEYNQSQDEETSKELDDMLTDLRSRVEELRGGIITVYNLIPLKYDYYGLDTFEVISEDNEGQEYTVGNEIEMDKAAFDYAKNYVDELGLEGFNQNFIEEYLDTDSIEEFFRDFLYDDVRDNTDVYFDESEMPTSEKQNRRKEELEEYIEKVRVVIEKMEKKQEDLNDLIEDPNDYEKEWNEIEERIKIIQGHLDDSQQEIDDMVPEGEATTQMIEDKVDDLVNEKMNDPRAALDELGMEISNYVDMDALAKGLVDSDGYGILGSYDGSYDTEKIKDTYYYIMRVS